MERCNVACRYIFSIRAKFFQGKKQKLTKGTAEAALFCYFNNFMFDIRIVLIQIQDRRLILKDYFKVSNFDTFGYLMFLGVTNINFHEYPFRQ